MARLLIFLGFVLLSNIISPQASAQQCSPYVNNNPNTSYPVRPFGNVPVGFSYIRLLSGYGVGPGDGTIDVQVDFTASLDACSDPAFTLMRYDCETPAGGGRECHAVIGFFPITVGYRSAILRGNILFHSITYPSGYVQPEVHAGDAYFLEGVGTEPATQKSLTIALSSPAILPFFPGNPVSPHQTAVFAKISGGPPGTSLAGNVIQFLANPQELTGGHNHSGNRPTGIFLKADCGDNSLGTCLTNSCITDTTGMCSVFYSASEVAGKVKIAAALVGDSSPNTIDTEDLIVGVPLLTEIFPDQFFRLTGNQNHPEHPRNHFMTIGAASSAITLAGDFFEVFHATIGFNDMSLPLGGLFDIGPTVSAPKGPLPFWQAPHVAHRVGRSLDLDQCAESTIANDVRPRGPVLNWRGNPVRDLNGSIRYCPIGWIAVPKDEIRDMCKNLNGKIQVEEPIHCEFSK